MFSYSLVVEGLNSKEDAKKLKNALEELGDTRVTINYRKGEVSLDTSERVEAICEVIEECGLELVELEMV